MWLLPCVALLSNTIDNVEVYLFFFYFFSSTQLKHELVGWLVGLVLFGCILYRVTTLDLSGARQRRRCGVDGRRQARNERSGRSLKICII